ncbi:MAG: hypothetical protein ACK4TI_05930, partial [Nitrososphaerales archaeon]
MIEDALKSEFEELCRMIDGLGIFKTGITIEDRKIIDAKNRELKKIKLIIDSIRIRNNALYCV